VIEKSLQQLIKETEAILDAKKKKLEAKQNKTQEERESLVDLNFTYKLTGAWNDVPILLATSKKRYTEPMNNSATNKDHEILELKKQIQLLKQEKSILIGQTKELPPIKHEESNLKLQIKESDRQLTLLRNDFQLVQHKNIAFQNQIKTNDSKMASLQRENQELKLKINSLEQQGREKDNKINSLENEKHGHHRTSIQQTQTLNSLKQEKQTMEQSRKNTSNEMERLKSSYTILEQLLKSKEDTIVSLNRENQMLSTANQGNQQGANEMVDTLKSLLQSKNSEIELNSLKMEHALDKEKEKIKKLLKEIKRLKQTASSRETSPSNTTTVPEATTSNTRTNEDDPNNDFNYDTECGTEYSSSDDTSSEDGDHANDLNYDSDV
jgi:chromosome segregation ATPase